MKRHQHLHPLLIYTATTKFNDNNNMLHNVTRRMDHYEGFREALVEYQRISHIGSEYERKQVYQIRCGHCLTILTNRGMNVSCCCIEIS